MTRHKRSLAILVALLLTTARLFSQTPKFVETDLLKSFKKIWYWDRQKAKTTAILDDSLEAANDDFADKLKAYAVKYPSTISEPFPSLKKEHLDIFTSDDGKFRIYSWETWMGGTMRDFANLLQYRTGTGTAAVLLTSTGETYIPYYKALYTFSTGDKTYYLGVYGTIYSTKDAGTGIKVFAIENGRLNDNVKLIKTTTGLKNKIYYDYDFFSVMNIPVDLRPTITFDAQTKVIKVPLVDQNGKVSGKFITYKFNGQYFEKVKL